MTDAPWTSSTTFPPQKKLNMKCDIWRGVNILSKFQLPALTVWDRQCLEDSELKDHSMNELIVNDKGAFRTAPAIPGLLDIKIKFLKT